MLEVSLATILTVCGAILAPLLTVIRVLWVDRVKREDKADADRATDRAAYDAMRDKMQDKIDQANNKANDAVATAATTVNSMTSVINAVNETTKGQVAQWPIFKDEVIRSVNQAMQGQKVT